MVDTLERDDTKVLVCHAVSKNDLWSDVFGSGWEDAPWWMDIEFIDCDWETHGQAKVTCLDPDDPDEQMTMTKVITVIDLANAVSALTESGYTHCHGHSLTSADACTSDAILQRAVYDDIIYC